MFCPEMRWTLETRRIRKLSIAKLAFGKIVRMESRMDSMNPKLLRGRIRSVFFPCLLYSQTSTHSQNERNHRTRGTIVNYSPRVDECDV